MPSEFSLFESEERILEEGKRNLDALAFGSEETRAAYRVLLDAYRASFREKRRLVRLSDKLQEQLSGLNDELQVSKEAAEQALQRLRETQEQLVQAEKLSSLGVVVAGVAHEINTPVGTALASASYLGERTRSMRRALDAGQMKKSDLTGFIDAAEEAAGLILTNCSRAAELIQGFKQVAVDQTTAEVRRFNLKHYFGEVLTSLRPRLRPTPHQVEVRCPDDLEVDSVPGAVSQILTNFVMNSLTHAFPDGQAGHLTLSAERLDGGMIRVVYGDDGRGIPEADLPRIFDPFFTTRRGSGGTGLGLHIVYNTVVGTLKGQIGVDSAPGRGTRFTMTFPADVRGEAQDG